MVQDMGMKKSYKWHRTKYPSLFYIHGTSPSTGKQEKIFSIQYTRKGEKHRERAGRESVDEMTAAGANSIRVKKLEGDLPSNREIREAEKAL